VKIATGKKAEDLTWPIHISLTVVLLVGTTAIVLLLLSLGLSSGSAFNLILNITGGIGGTSR
jgi:ABC-type nickel/cobalt efflux system permease component RcnA